MLGSLLTLQHRLNPLHLYCRFVEWGLDKRISTSICKVYEGLVFVWINWTIRHLVRFLCLISRTSVQEVLRNL